MPPETPEILAELAVLSEKMDNMSTMLEKKIQADEKKMDDYEARIRILENRSIKHEQRLNVQTGILGTLTVIGSSLAAYLGVKF